MKKKYKVFTSLSRRKRRIKTFEIKNLIRRERYRCGGTFYDNCDVDAASSSWHDVLFLGRDNAVFWNAEIITTSVAFHDEVSSIAFDEVWSMLDENERKRQLSLSDKSIFPQFGGLTFTEYLEKREKEIAQETPPVIRCSYRILPGYVHGIGLQIILDVDVLSRDIIESAITDFIAQGEREWISNEIVCTKFFQKSFISKY